ncbi:MAG: hypothetical protein CL678_00865 [Bdellovibrionaceae bacterium]|nr:hypothetical protein [Pseudobdellovibrionaceae bacterium]|tara:strand:+ start:3796 stop:4593 length:798 start_codon:yes stop_codon:yes gene_type:complete
MKLLPHLIFQTFHTPTAVPEHVASMWGTFAPGWSRHVYDDAACVGVLRSQFSSDFSSTFHGLAKGAHRADLCRYALMYMYGGVYADIKFDIKTPLARIVELSGNASIASVIAADRKSIFQGFILAVPKQPLFLRLMIHMRMTVESKQPYKYDHFIKFMMEHIHETDHHLFQEDCAVAGAPYLIFRAPPAIFGLSGLDRYCRVCAITSADGAVIAKTRFDDYPWGAPPPPCRRRLAIPALLWAGLCAGILLLVLRQCAFYKLRGGV